MSSDQIQFLSHFWRQKETSKTEEEIKTHVENVVQQISVKLHKSNEDFMAIALHLKMISEAYNYDEIVDGSDATLNFNLFDLYDKFCDKLMKIWLNKGEVANEEQINIIKNPIRLSKIYHNEALLHIFGEENMDTDIRNVTELKEIISRIGIYQKLDSKKFQFIHETFAEFYVADYILTNMNNENASKVAPIFVKVLSDKKHQVTT